jgi:sigma-E factor negative regulatory protein RseC
MAEVYSDENCQIDSYVQNGIIERLDREIYFISITSQSACAACHSKAICGMTEGKDKTIEVPRKRNDDFKIGDEVEVLMEKSIGSKAVFIGYIIPFFMLLITLIVSLELFQSEIISGILSITILAVYYFSLYYLRDKIKKNFKFSIRHRN